MLKIARKFSPMLSAATLVVVIGFGIVPSQLSATPLPAAISARIAELSGLSPQNISEILVVERAAKIVIIAYDINIPIVVEPRANYLLVRNASTGGWIRVDIDAAEWVSDFRPYFDAFGVEILRPSYGAVAALTADQEATQLAATATVAGSLTARLVLTGSTADPESRIIYIHTDLLGSPVSESNEAGEIE